MNPPAVLELIQTPVDLVAVGGINILLFCQICCLIYDSYKLMQCYDFSESLDVAARAAAEENKRNEEVLRWLSPILMCSVLTLCWHQPWLILGWKGHSRRRIFCLFQKTMMLTRMKPLPDLVWSHGGQGKKNHPKILSWWMGVENSNCIYKDYHCIPGMRGWLMKRGVSKPEG